MRYRIIKPTILKNTYDIVGKTYDIVGFRLFLATLTYDITYDIVGQNLQYRK